MGTPIACTLNPGEYQSRIGALSALGERALRSRQQTARGERLTFRASDEIEQQLRAAVAAEAACCSFLTMNLRRADDGLVLDIAGPDDARPIIAGLFA